MASALPYKTWEWSGGERHIVNQDWPEFTACFWNLSKQKAYTGAIRPCLTHTVPVLSTQRYNFGSARILPLVAPGSHSGWIISFT
jgi:hypothetical protein